MKINPIPRPNMIKSYYTNQVAAPGKGKVAAGADEVAFSEQALSFSKVLAEVKASDVRSAEELSRIANIATLVQRGEYQIDSRMVAEKMIRAVLADD